MILSRAKRPWGLQRKQFRLKLQNLLILREHIAIGMANATRQQAQQASHELRGRQGIYIKHLNKVISLKHGSAREDQGFAGGRMGLPINEANFANHRAGLREPLHQMPTIFAVAAGDFCLTGDDDHQMPFIGLALLREVRSGLEIPQGHQRRYPRSNLLGHALKCRAAA